MKTLDSQGLIVLVYLLTAKAKGRFFFKPPPGPDPRPLGLPVQLCSFGKWKDCGEWVMPPIFYIIFCLGRESVGVLSLAGGHK